jgi:hypothetical protein
VRIYSVPDVRFLFVTIQGFESEFYGRTGAELRARGHDVVHLTYSRLAARLLREDGFDARSLKDVLDELDIDIAAEARRINDQYGVEAITDAYRTDPPAERRSPAWCRDRAVRHFVAMERLFDEVEPGVLVPEVGSELIRTVAHLVALERDIPTLFLFYTIFPRPLRLYIDTMHAPIVPPDELRELTEEERAQVDQFRRSFTERAEPIRTHRRPGVTRRRIRRLAMYTKARVGEDRDNEYLRPETWLVEQAIELPRRLAARVLYARPEADRPFVYFPLHMTDDYKIKRVIPQWVDQAAVVDQVADSLPAGYDLVVKEHPMSIGRNQLAFLRRLMRRRNVRLVPPQTGSHDLIRAAAGVAVISSTVGLEALLYRKPVLTMGRPFYSGYGVTLDIDSLAEIPDAVRQLLRFNPEREQIDRLLHAAMRRCHAGAPVLIDDSDANAARLADSLGAAANSLNRTRAALA